MVLPSIMLYYLPYWHMLSRQPTLVFLPGGSHGQRNLVGYSPWGHKELDTATKQQQTKPNSYIHSRRKLYHLSKWETDSLAQAETKKITPWLGNAVRDCASPSFCIPTAVSVTPLGKPCAHGKDWGGFCIFRCQPFPKACLVRVCPNMDGFLACSFLNWCQLAVGYLSPQS